MNRAEGDITILSFGDRLDYDEYKKFNRERRLFIKRGFDYVAVSYKNVLRARFPKIRTNKIIIFLFFPFHYWNKNIEYKDYKGIYGNRIFYKKFMNFWIKINDIINEHFSDKQILVINNPLLSGRYRDKQLIKLKLSRAGISNPRTYRTNRIQDIHNLLAQGSSLYLKVRYGSMGKGITYVSPLNWETNFNFKDNKIISRRSDHGWKFRYITGNNAFLNKLIKKDILIEKAVDTMILKRKRIDLRIYTFLKKVVYIYPKTNYPERITTNISQGAKGAPYILEFVPKKLIAKAKKLAIESARVLKLDLAGIDVMLDRNHKDVCIVDVNVFPGFPKRRTFNLTRAIIRELARADNKGRLRFEKSPSGKH
jgi:hypothetical protein